MANEVPEAGNRDKKSAKGRQRGRPVEGLEGQGESYVRRHAKASTAGSNRQKAAKLVLPVSLFAALLALLVVVGSASASKSHAFKELFGSAAQPTFTTARSIAVDQSIGDVLVMDAGSPPSIKRYKPDGTADNFSALGSNVIDGKEGADATPQAGLSFASASESQIAVDNSGTATDGDIYVTQGSPNLINIFSSTGAYLGQLTKAGATNFNEACGVAVDSAGAVYVGDYSGGIRKFVPSANPVVNTDNTATYTTTSQPCTLAAGAGATAGFLFPAKYNGPISKIDSSTGELKYIVSSDSNTTVSVDPASGHVYAATGSTIKEFDASGAGSATTVSNKTELASGVQGLAVRGSTGDIYASRSGNSKVEVFGSTILTFPDVTTTAATNNTGVHATLNGTVNPDGVELSECKFEWGRRTFQGGEGISEHTTPCAESNATIGAGTSAVAVHVDLSGLQPNGAQYEFRLVAKNAISTAAKGSAELLTTLTTVDTTAASGTTPNTTTLNGTVNPDGVAMTECLFEWGATVSYGDTAPCVPNAGGIGSGTSPVAVHADLSGLSVGTTYHYRLKAANVNGPILGTDKSVLTLGPVIGAAWSENVVYTEAVLRAEINPEGSATTYHFEYGPTAAYGSETPESGVGSDSSAHEVIKFLDGLTPGTTYHYRAVATNPAATNVGSDHTLTTSVQLPPDTDCPNQEFRYGPSGSLPDCRAYEMVSPVDKDGGRVLTAGGIVLSAGGLSSRSGEKVVFKSTSSFGDAPSAPSIAEYLATRGSDGWTTHGISSPQTGYTLSVGGLPPLGPDYYGFSEDLSSGFLLHASDPLTPDGLKGYVDLYRRNLPDGGYAPLMTTPPPHVGPAFAFPFFEGMSADASHAVFRFYDALTPGAPYLGEAAGLLYDWVDGQLRLVGILPDGEPAMTSTSLGFPSLGAFGSGSRPNVDNAISEDGSRIFWSIEDHPGFGDDGPLFVRIDGDRTVAVSESVAPGDAQFWTAKADGSTAVFTVGTRTELKQAGIPLYEFDVDSETPTMIVPKVRGVLGASDDLSYIYFISKQALDAGATAGEANLYVLHEGSPTYVATLSDPETEVSYYGASGGGAVDEIEPTMRTSYVSPTGGLVFTSTRSLTGYDNTDAATGQADAEVFRYDPESQELDCASCDPSGARPTGRPVQIGENSIPSAALIPRMDLQLHQARSLTEGGTRVYFESYGPLVPGDTNGKTDVYQWEAEGAGTCEEPGGCISLISTGKSPKDSEFVDIGATGNDVFFTTDSSIAPQDPGVTDVYDARVGGGTPPPPEPPPACVGDACQSPPSAPQVATPASAGFHGAGNPISRRNCAASAKRALKLHHRAKRLLREAGRLHGGPRMHNLYRRSLHLSKRASLLSKNASRCRRANRGAGR